MSARSDQLRRRRELLVLRAAAQRDEVSFVAAQLQQRMRILDLGFAVGQILRDHPLLALAGTSLLWRAPRNKLVIWMSRVYTGWELFSDLEPMGIMSKPEIPVDFTRVETRTEFVALLRKFEDELRDTGRIPALHIETRKRRRYWRIE